MIHALTIHHCVRVGACQPAYQCLSPVLLKEAADRVEEAAALRALVDWG